MLPSLGWEIPPSGGATRRGFEPLQTLPSRVGLALLQELATQPGQPNTPLRLDACHVVWRISVPYSQALSTLGYRSALALICHVGITSSKDATARDHQSDFSAVAGWPLGGEAMWPAPDRANPQRASYPPSRWAKPML
jgi:hypothetical protein